MAKNKNAASAAQEALKNQKAPETTKTDEKKTSNQPTNKVEVIQLKDLEQFASQSNGLDPNHTVDLLGMLNERFYRDKDASVKYNIAQDNVDKINEITAVGMVAVLANEVQTSKSQFAIAMRRTQLESIVEVAKSMKIDIDTTKLLPVPEDKTGDVVALPSTSIKPSKEAKKEMEEEKKIANKKVEIDPTKIENEQQLKDTLSSILVKGNGSDRFYDKVHAAIEFYRAYLSIQAQKSENKDEELTKIKNKSQAELFSDIANLLGKCTFTISSMAKFMYEATERSKSPVAAFCMFRDASLNKTTGMPQIEDQLCADIVKVLITWYVNNEILSSKEVIDGFKRDIEILKKDEKKNAKAIATGESKIKDVENHIEDLKKVIEYVNIPNREVIDNFKSDYVDNKAEGFKMARMIGSKIMKTYYNDAKPKDVKMENLIHNLHQYMGIITNMFLPPLEKMADFSESNITELEKIEKPEEKK